MTTTMKKGKPEIEVIENDLPVTGKIESTNQVATGLIIMLASLVGIWGLACFFGGLAKIGNPIEMVRLWISAITGM